MATANPISRRSILKAAPAVAAVALVPAVVAAAPGDDAWFIWADAEQARLLGVMNAPGTPDAAADAAYDAFTAIVDEMIKRPAQGIRGLLVKTKMLGYWEDDISDPESETWTAPKVYRSVLADLERLACTRS